MNASPEDVWAILAHPPHYGYWVVGSSEIESWDVDWPAPGTRFDHKVGYKPFRISDHTEVVEADEPYRLVLRAKARPLGIARVVLELEPHPEGTKVTMVEDPEGIYWLVMPPPMHIPMRLRNAESLRRLRELAES